MKRKGGWYLEANNMEGNVPFELRLWAAAPLYLQPVTQKYSADRNFTYKVLTFENELLSHHSIKSSEKYIILKEIP
jgi:hypothetical protein